MKGPRNSESMEELVENQVIEVTKSDEKTSGTVNNRELDAGREKDKHDTKNDHRKGDHRKATRKRERSDGESGGESNDDGEDEEGSLLGLHEEVEEDDVDDINKEALVNKVRVKIKRC